MHVDRAKIIEELYKILVKLQSSSLDLLGPQGIVNKTIDETIDESTKRELVFKVVQETNELFDEYKINRIYFSEDICKLIESIVAYMQVIVSYIGYPSNTIGHELQVNIPVNEKQRK